MRVIALSLAGGLLFGAGLVVSGMSRPDTVTAFLDLLSGWNPGVMLVMAGALAVHALAYRLVPRMSSPLLGGKWAIPTRRDVDGRLLTGAALFGAGWGLSGYCPGPALVALPTGESSVLIFALSMLGGMWLHHQWEAHRSAAAAPAPAPIQATVPAPRVSPDLKEAHP